MCGPVASIVAGVIGLGGNLLQGVGAAEERETNAVTYEMNAAGLDRDILAEQESSAYEIARTREMLQRTQGSARAAYGANGLALEGSAAEVLRETAIEGELDIEAIRWTSKSKQDSMAYQRDVFHHNAGRERSAKGLAFITPVISGAARFAGSFG